MPSSKSSGRSRSRSIAGLACVTNHVARTSRSMSAAAIESIMKSAAQSTSNVRRIGSFTPRILSGGEGGTMPGVGSLQAVAQPGRRDLSEQLLRLRDVGAVAAHVGDPRGGGDDVAR